MKIITITIILIFINLITVNAQNQDTIKLEERHKFIEYILPVGLITYGIGARTIKPIRKIDHKIGEYVDSHVNKDFPIDNYIEIASVATVFGLSLTGIEAKHNFRDRTIVEATSYLLTAGIVRTMKYTIDVQRPDSKDNMSFPSGHAATVFTGAQILFHEYRDASVWIPVAGYTLAVGTGVLRVVNKHHWFSDVMTGAGIGILSAEAGYLLLPVFHKMFGIKEKDNNLVILPSININYYGIGLAYSF
jgi:membrane-associated phospholipid phosphatase